MSELNIRKAEERDVEAITMLEHVSIPNPWSREMIRKDIVENKMSNYIIAEIDGTPAGFIGFMCVVEQCEITNVAVNPFMREQHIGTVLVKTMLDASIKAGIKHFHLEVRASNEAAIKLYKNCGFEQGGVRREYYSDGEDAILMAKYI